MSEPVPFYYVKGVGARAVHAEACFQAPFHDHFLSREDWAVIIKFYEARNWVAGAFGDLVPDLLLADNHQDFKARFKEALRKAGYAPNRQDIFHAYTALMDMSWDARYRPKSEYRFPTGQFATRLEQADADLAIVLRDKRVGDYKYRQEQLLARAAKAASASPPSTPPPTAN